MPIWKNYHLAISIEDALDTLEKAQGPALCVAGGTDLLLDLQQGRHHPVDTLVDVTGIRETTCLEQRGEELYVGSCVPLSQIVKSDLVRHNAQALTEACGLIGGPQVRNTATLGGNVAHALPAADGTIALVALGADVEIASKEGLRRMPIQQLFVGPGKSSLDPRREMLVGFFLPLRQPEQGSVHKRIMRPQGVAIAILNMSVWLHRMGDTIQDIQIALGPAGPVPLRARKTEAFFQGKAFSPDIHEPAYQTLLSEAQFRTSPHRATAVYRKHMAGVLLHDTVCAAWERSYL